MESDCDGYGVNSVTITEASGSSKRSSLWFD